MQAQLPSASDVWFSKATTKAQTSPMMLEATPICVQPILKQNVRRMTFGTGVTHRAMCNDMCGNDEPVGRAPSSSNLVTCAVSFGELCVRSMMTGEIVKNKAAV